MQEKGEKQVLIEGTEKGDENAPSQGTLLAEKYPEEALEAIVEGARKAKDPWARTDLVRIAGDSEGDVPVPFLLHEIKWGPFLVSRVAAATALHTRGRPEAVAAMIADWKRLKAVEAPHGYESHGIRVLIGFLARCGKPEAIVALGQDLQKCPALLRFHVVNEFGDLSRSFMPVGPKGWWISKSGTTKEEKAAAFVEIEKLLVAVLEDTEQPMSMSVSWDGKTCDDPRICDLAGHALSQRWPDKYTFDLSGALKNRNRQRVQCMNVWRRAQNLRALELPDSQ